MHWVAQEVLVKAGVLGCVLLQVTASLIELHVPTSQLACGEEVKLQWGRLTGAPLCVKACKPAESQSTQDPAANMRPFVWPLSAHVTNLKITVSMISKQCALQTGLMRYDRLTRECALGRR